MQQVSKLLAIYYIYIYIFDLYPKIPKKAKVSNVDVNKKKNFIFLIHLKKFFFNSNRGGEDVNDRI